jgi:hypothetical protein
MQESHLSQENDETENMSEDEALFHEVTAKFLNMIGDQFSETNCGNGKTVRISLDVPVEWMTMFAWIEYRKALYIDDQWGPHDLSSLFPLSENQKRSAKFYIRHFLSHEFESEYRSLLTGDNPLLRSYKANKEPSNNLDLPDEIPF